tara:strand:- start:601 stop:1134 length:534 start_codon:yes stop_codon:yes gene_type:complete
MKKLLIFIFYPLLSTGQSNSEIVAWLNQFENNYAVERILQGTLREKVNIFYKNGSLVVNSLIWNGRGNTPPESNCEIDLSKVKRIFAEPKRGSEKTLVDINICAEPGFIKIFIKNPITSSFVRFDDEEFLKKSGYCDASIRLKFHHNESTDQIKRILNALQTLSKNHGANPVVGSLF